MENINKNQQ